MVFKDFIGSKLLQINFAYHSLGPVGPFMQTQNEGG